jgi:hypothetical protein
MSSELATKKGMLWRVVALMFVISGVLTVSGVLEFAHNGELSGFAALEIVIGGWGIIVIVTVVAWLLTLVL